MRRGVLLLLFALPVLFSVGCKRDETDTEVPPVIEIEQTTAAATATVPPASTSTPQVPTDTPTKPPACPPATLPFTDWAVYCNETYGFYVQYPADAVPGEADLNAIRIDLPVAPDTNLREKYVSITVQESSAACTSPLTSGYAEGSFTRENTVINGVNFLIESGMDAGVGNYWQWFAYTTGKRNLCVSFDFVIHSTNRFNYPTPPPEFDLELESAVFDEIVGTFNWYTP